MLGWAWLTAASGESPSAETARSPIETIPTICPAPSMTGSLRTAFSLIRCSAWATSASAATPTSLGLQSGPTGASGPTPAARPRTTRSRSVTTPASDSPLTTRTAPTWASRMIRAVSAIVWSK